MAKGRVKQVEMVFRTHGGKRRGAGRKPKSKRAGARHEARPEHDPRHPVHVTIRVVGNIDGLRRGDIYAALREATIVTAKREDFRISHMSIQRDHIHLIVEADDKAALSKGVRGFSISAARQINIAITARGVRRTGKVISDRFHARSLTSPRAVRNAVAYTLRVSGVTRTAAEAGDAGALGRKHPTVARAKAIDARSASSRPAQGAWSRTRPAALSAVSGRSGSWPRRAPAPRRAAARSTPRAARR